MKRRTYLAALTAGLTSTAGCQSPQSVRSFFRRNNRRLDKRNPAKIPDGEVYVPPHYHGTGMIGMETDGRYKIGIMYAAPDPFWTVTNSDVSKHPAGSRDNAHLMATVWDRKTGYVLPDAGVSMRVKLGTQLVSQEVIYPMLSQRMGFHYGANFQFEGEETHRVTVSVGGISATAYGDFKHDFSERGEVTARFKYTADKITSLALDNPENPYEKGALTPPRSKMPRNTLKATPNSIGKVRIDGLDVVLSHVFHEELPTKDAGYLAAFPVTPYNQFRVPNTALEVDIEGETVKLNPGFSPGLGFHYGAGIESLPKDRDITVRMTVPPQVARHLGYEVAFTEGGEASVTYTG